VTLPRRLAAEGLGSAFLLVAIVGSGIMAERLADDAALALLANTAATAAMLFVLIAMFAPVSGAHFNPAVTLVAALARDIAPKRALGYVAVQVAGAAAGVWLAHAMFGDPIFALGIKERAGAGQWLAEGVAAFGLILTVLGTVQHGVRTAAASMALYIAAAYWFTASTAFANPAVTIARALTPTFAGIRPEDAPFFIAAQLVGALVAAILGRWLFPVPGKAV
jgi:glycerol uptake facilitator-like aquaporin